MGKRYVPPRCISAVLRTGKKVSSVPRRPFPVMNRKVGIEFDLASVFAEEPRSNAVERTSHWRECLGVHRRGNDVVVGRHRLARPGMAATRPHILTGNRQGGSAGFEPFEALHVAARVSPAEPL